MGTETSQQGQNSLLHYLNKMKVLMLLSVLQITFGLGVGKTYLVDTASSGSSELTGGCRGPGNVWYKKGDSFRSSDGCNTCFCNSRGDGYACTRQACWRLVPSTKQLANISRVDRRSPPPTATPASALEELLPEP